MDFKSLLRAVFNPRWTVPLLLVTLAATIGVAWAVTYQKVSVVNDPLPQWFQAGMFIGNPDSGVTDRSMNRLTRMTVGQATIDFGAVSGAAQGGVTTPLNTVCRDGAAIDVRGAKQGDTCIVGSSVAGINAFSRLTARVTAADQAVVTVCADGYTDGGSIDLASATYTVRCFSNTF